MDWLIEDNASIDCHKKEVIFLPLSRPNFMFKGIYTETTLKIVSMTKAKRLVQEGGLGYISMCHRFKRKRKDLRHNTSSE